MRLYNIRMMRIVKRIMITLRTVGHGNNMRETRKKTVIPVYGFAAAWCLYCVFFPLYKTWHYIVLACGAAAVFMILSIIFPGKTEYVEIPQEPVRTGDGRIDALLEDGEKAVAELRRLGEAIGDDPVREKLEGIIVVTDRIFKDLLDDPDDYKQVKRFHDFYLPTTIKLMYAYERLRRTETDGGNIGGTMQRIDNALDTVFESYNKFFDSLFKNQALDIETDIMVLENILKQEGFKI